MIRLTSGLSIVAALLAAPAVAQDARQTTTPPSDGSQSENDGAGQVKDIVVTAQRRQERLQDVPISISAVTADQMAAQGITNIKTLVQSVPGLTVPTQGTSITPYIRGVGSNGADPNNEPSVAIYIDGVYIAAPFANTLSLNNIDRVEVLKGPQGTLFGRNATGGVIQVITRTPTQTPTLEASAGYANYDDVTADFYGSTGLGEGAAIDLAVQYENQSNGYGRNILLDEDTYKKKEFSARSKLVLEPSDSTKVVVSGDYGRTRNSLVQYHLPEGAIGLDGQPHYFGRFKTDTDSIDGIFARQYGGSARVEQQLGFASLVSITAYRNAKGQFDTDSDGTPQRRTEGHLHQTGRTFSQELQLASAASSKIKWVLGAFYFDSRSGYEPAELIGLDIAGPTTFVDFYSVQNTRSASAYAQATAPISDRTNLTGGLRYTIEKQHFDSTVQTVDQPTGDLTSSTEAPRTRQEFKKFTWRLAIDHEFADRIRGYISYNRGIKSGGFDFFTPGSTGYKPEQIDAYEVGLKTDLFDRRLRLNLAAFYYDYKDIQTTTVVVGGIVTGNAGAAHVKGLEADFEGHPFKNFVLSGGVGYLDSKYADFKNPVDYDASGHQVFIANAKGNYTTRAPKWTSNLAATYTVPTSTGSFSANANLYYNSGYFYNPTNRARQLSYALLNTSISWEAPSGKWGIDVWARNLTDTHYLDQVAPSSNGDLTSDAEPRRYGVTARFKL